MPRVATFPVRPWYSWKRDVCFIDVLRAAQAALRRTGILDLLRNDADLSKTVPPRVLAPPEPLETAA